MVTPDTLEETLRKSVDLAELGKMASLGRCDYRCEHPASYRVFKHSTDEDPMAVLEFCTMHARHYWHGMEKRGWLIAQSHRTS